MGCVASVLPCGSVVLVVSVPVFHVCLRLGSVPLLDSVSWVSLDRFFGSSSWVCLDRFFGSSSWVCLDRFFGSFLLSSSVPLCGVLPPNFKESVVHLRA